MSISYDQAVDWAIQGGIALLILFIGLCVARIASVVLTRSLNRLKVDQILIDFSRSILRLLIILFALLMALEQLGVNTTSVMTVLGAASIAVGLALQKSLSNFAAGILLIITRPFALNDNVDVGGVSGKVLRIRLFSTLLQTGDNRAILVPNGRIIEREIINYSAHSTRRVEVVISVAYSTDLQQVRDVLLATMAADERIIIDPAPTVDVHTLAASSIDVMVKAWAPTKDFGAVKATLLENIKTAFDAADIVIPFPQQDIHLVKHDER